MVSISASLILSLSLSALAPLVTGVRYLALGDSYAAGVGSGGFAQPSKFPDFDRCCFRRSTAYPIRVNRDLSTTFFDFRACSGAQATGPGNTVEASQLRSPPPNIDFVTVTVGGNDIGFRNVVTSCLITVINAQNCLNAAAEAKRKAETELPSKFSTLDSRLRTLYPRAKIAFTGYPLPYPSTRRFFGNPTCPGFDVRSAVNDAIIALNNVIRANVRNFIPISFEGHDICRLLRPWFQKILTPALVRQATARTPQCSVSRLASRGYGGTYHPNVIGNLEYAKAIVQWYRQN